MDFNIMGGTNATLSNEGQAVRQWRPQLALIMFINEFTSCYRARVSGTHEILLKIAYVTIALMDDKQQLL